MAACGNQSPRRNSITFTQTLAGAYEYEKTLRIVGNQLVIEHRLKNLGAAPISTTVYDHNFLRLAPGNAGVTVTFPFAVKAATPPPADLMAHRRPQPDLSARH